MSVPLAPRAMFEGRRVTMNPEEFKQRFADLKYFIRWR
jgi:hypothetical protein